MKRLLVVPLGIASLTAGLACGPSFQAIYEGNARFEHCYALEENGQTPMVDKADCWRDWSEHYTYGQTRDRIHYATARYVALSTSTSAPTDEAMMMAAPGMTPRQSTITAPAPTNAFAPPPKVLDDADASTGKPVSPRLSEMPKVVDAGGPDAILASLPASACGEGCGKTFRDCKSTCGGDAGTRAAQDAACAACEKSYRGCMRGCFK